MSARLDALLAEPTLRDTPGVTATLRAWIRDSDLVEEPPDGFPVYAFVDPWTGNRLAWAVQSHRPNGLHGWLRGDLRAPSGPAARSWRIDPHGRVHRGCTWLVSRAQPRRTLVELLRVLATQAPETHAWQFAQRDARALLGESPTG